MPTNQNGLMHQENKEERIKFEHNLEGSSYSLNKQTLGNLEERHDILSSAL